MGRKAFRRINSKSRDPKYGACQWISTSPVVLEKWGVKTEAVRVNIRH